LVKTVVLGKINWDTSLFLDRFPKSGEEVVVQRIVRVPGGKAGNTAVAGARLLGPAKVAILGGLGKDSIGAEQVKIFEKEGVLTSGLKFSEEAESGQAYITIDAKGANIIHTYAGANATITPADLDEPVRRGLISEAAVVSIMDPPFEAAMKLAETAKVFGKVVAWDPGVIARLGITKVRGLLKNVDYLIANEHESADLTGITNHDDAAKKLLDVNKEMRVVVKLGEKGCIMYAGEKRTALPNLDLPRAGLKVVNTVGCGDAFLGAFTAAVSEGLSDLDALRWGNCAGGLKATRLETRGSPTREMLLKHLQ